MYAFRFIIQIPTVLDIVEKINKKQILILVENKIIFFLNGNGSWHVTSLSTTNIHWLLVKNCNQHRSFCK